MNKDERLAIIGELLVQRLKLPNPKTHELTVKNIIHVVATKRLLELSDPMFTVLGSEYVEMLRAFADTFELALKEGIDK